MLPALAELCVEVACQDIVSCLDHLGIKRAALLFLCAGTPYALAFASRYPERVAGGLFGLSTWVSPSDCKDAKLLFRVGAGLPGPFVAAAMSAFAVVMHSTPTSMTARSLGEAELEAQIDQPVENFNEFLFDWIRQETGGEGDDVATLVDSSKSWGVDYKHIAFPVFLFHGAQDVVVPIHCVNWLLNRFPEGSILHEVKGGGHDDVMIIEAGQILRLAVRKYAVSYEDEQLLPLEPEGDNPISDILRVQGIFLDDDSWTEEELNNEEESLDLNCIQTNCKSMFEDDLRLKQQSDISDNATCDDGRSSTISI